MDSVTILVALLLAIPAVLVYRSVFLSNPTVASTATTATTSANDKESEEAPKTIMQAPRTDLDPPKDDPFTLEQLKAFDGSDPSKPIYVSIKGAVFFLSGPGFMRMSAHWYGRVRC